jgi:hypothetical protein
VDLALAVRLASSEITQVTLNETTDRNAVAVDKVALLVQGKSIKNGEIVRNGFLFLRERLSVTLDVAVLVKNVTILIHSVANEALSVALNNLTNNVLILVSNLAVSNDAEAFKTSEWSLRLSLALVLGNELDAANDLSGVVPELALVIELLTSKLLGVAFDETCDWHTFVADDVALLVDSLALEAGKVDGVLLGWRLLLRLFVAFGMTDN